MPAPASSALERPWFPPLRPNPSSRAGFPLYADSAVILRESRRQDLAHRFIDYLLRPEVSAAVVQATKTATANAAAQARFPEALRANPTLFPPAEVLARGEWVQTMPAAAQRLRDRLWTEIKAA